VREYYGGPSCDGLLDVSYQVRAEDKWNSASSMVAVVAGWELPRSKTSVGVKAECHMTGMWLVKMQLYLLAAKALLY
jgi:hypothetical protein